MNAPPLSVERIDETFRQLFRPNCRSPARFFSSSRSPPGWRPLATTGSTALYRAVHNLKGNAATFGFHAIVAICHSL